MGTHSFTFAELDEAYDVFREAAANSALKVVITPGLTRPDQGTRAARADTPGIPGAPRPGRALLIRHLRLYGHTWVPPGQ